MRAERSSPGTVEAPRVAGSELREATDARSEKEGKVLRASLVKRGNGVLQEAHAPFKLDDEGGHIGLDFDVEREFKIKDYEGFDLDELAGDPSYRTETRRVGTIDYVVTERAGKETVIVRPDGQGEYPEKADLRAAMDHGLFVIQTWGSPEDIALIAHHYRRKSTEWLLSAIKALCAADPNLEPKVAAEKASVIIKGLIELHRKRKASL